MVEIVVVTVEIVAKNDKNLIIWTFVKCANQLKYIIYTEKMKKIINVHTAN